MRFGAVCIACKAVKSSVMDLGDTRLGIVCMGRITIRSSGPAPMKLPTRLGPRAEAGGSSIGKAFLRTVGLLGEIGSMHLRAESPMCCRDCGCCTAVAGEEAKVTTSCCSRGGGKLVTRPVEAEVRNVVCRSWGNGVPGPGSRTIGVSRILASPQSGGPQLLPPHHAQPHTSLQITSADT